MAHELEMGPFNRFNPNQTGNSMGQKLRRNPDDSVRSDVTKYYAAHPDSPAAQRHPHIVTDRGRFVALLGRSIKTGIFGFGSSVASALHTFDDLYKRTRRKPIR